MAKTTTKTVRPKPDRRKAAKPADNGNGAPVTISDEEIARRAFEVYCARGGQPGRELDDWLQAERELRELTLSAH